MITEKRRYGDAGEDLAVKYLQQKGYRLIGRNVQISHHEVDIVMRDGNCLVFVEVKTRKKDTFADPIRAVHDEKLWNLMEAAKGYKRLHPICYAMAFRIDVVCIVGEISDATPPVIEHLVDPFRRRIMEGIPWQSHYRKLRKGHFGFYRPGKL